MGAWTLLRPCIQYGLSGGYSRQKHDFQRCTTREPAFFCEMLAHFFTQKFASSSLRGQGRCRAIFFAVSRSAKTGVCCP